MVTMCRYLRNDLVKVFLLRYPCISLDTMSLEYGDIVHYKIIIQNDYYDYCEAACQRDIQSLKSKGNISVQNPC